MFQYHSMSMSTSTRHLGLGCVLLACAVFFAQGAGSQIVEFIPVADSILVIDAGDVPPALMSSIDTTAKPVDSIHVFGYAGMFSGIFDPSRSISKCSFVVANPDRRFEYRVLFLTDPPSVPQRIEIKRDTYTMVPPRAGYIMLVVSDSSAAIDSMRIRCVVEWLAGINDPPTREVSFRVMQNFPNPFNGQTTIRYSLPAGDFVTCDLYNVSGQRIRTYQQGRQTPGEHSLNLSLDAFPSGAYYMRVSTSSHVRTIGLTLIR